MTFTHALGTNNYGPAKFIVATSVANGTHTTLASALSAASSGDVVMLRDSVTENVTIPAGVNIVGWGGGGTTPVVSITGKITMTAAGTSTISNIRLTTNSDFAIVVSGSAASNLNLDKCYLNCSNNTGISMTTSNSSANINLNYCQGNLGTTGIKYFASTSPGSIDFYDCQMGNSGNSVTASTASAGFIGLFRCGFSNGIQTTSTATVFVQWSAIGQGNLIAIDHQGSVNANISYCTLVSGNTAAINIGVGSLIVCTFATLNSQAANAITGTGSLNFGYLNFLSTTTIAAGVTVSATDKNKQSWLQSPTQPAFLATKSSSVSNLTGAGALVTVTFTNVVKDQNSNYNGTDTFTAPVAGMYYFTTSIYTTGMLSGVNSVLVQFGGTQASGIGMPFSAFAPASSTAAACFNLSAFVSLAAGDTVTVTFKLSGGAGNTIGVSGAAGSINTNFAGFLVC